MLVLLRHSEVRENQDEDEDVVHGQGVLDQVPGQKLETRFLSHCLVDGEGEAKREGYPDRAPGRRFLEGDLGRSAVEQTQVEGEDPQNDYVESDPAPEA